MFFNFVNLIMRTLLYNFYFLFSLIILTLFTMSKSNGKGDLTRQKPISIEVLLKGRSGEFHYYEPSLLKFETGKLYKLKLKNLSDSKHYFTSNSHGYSYNLVDTAKYYGLYLDLMQFWGQSYSDRIYNLDYDKLTEDQEKETWRLVEYLDLNWEDACLSPHKNKRSVRTASQQQVREKVYRGSSEAWREYEKYLKGAFDSLGSL